MGVSNFLHFEIIVLILFIFSFIRCQIFHLYFMGSSFFIHFLTFVVHGSIFLLISESLCCFCLFSALFGDGFFICF
jgi:hypothetical protein